MSNKTRADDLAGITSAENGAIGQSHGLTKREYFAAMAMQGMLDMAQWGHEKRACDIAVRAADELIKALNAEID